MDVRTVPLSRRLNRVDCFIRDGNTNDIIDVVSRVSRRVQKYRVDDVFEVIHKWAQDSNEVVGVIVRGARLYVPYEMRATYSLLQKYGIEVKHGYATFYEDDEEDV